MMAATGSLPKFAADALALWDSGEALQAFQVETEGAEQEEIYAMAFTLIRATIEGKPAAEVPRSLALTDREHDVAASIAHIACTKGWAAMVRQHVGPHIEAITIRKA